MRSTSPTTSPNPARLNDHSLPSKPPYTPLTPPTLPFEVPSHIAKSIIYTTEPSDIFHSSKVHKGVAFATLYNKYVHQIQHGCQNPGCDKPSCLSFRRRHSKAPLRLYTDLSAKALAVQLLSERDPEAGLCRNEPFVPKDSGDALRGKLDKYTRRSSASPTKGNGAAAQPASNGHVESGRRRRKSSASEGANGHVKTPPQSPTLLGRQRSGQRSKSPRKPVLVPTDDEQSRVAERQQPSGQPKDPRSFTQWLFDGLSTTLLSYLSPQKVSSTYSGSASAATSDQEEVDVEDTRPRSVQSEPPQARALEPIFQLVTSSVDHAADQRLGQPAEDSTDQIKVHRHADAETPTKTWVSSPVAHENGHAVSSETQPKNIVEKRWQEQSKRQLPKKSKVHDHNASSTSEEPSSPVSVLTDMSKTSMQWLETLNKTSPSDGHQFTAHSVFYNLRKPDRVLKMLDIWHGKQQSNSGLQLDHKVVWDLFVHLRRLSTPGTVFRPLFEAVAQGFEPPSFLVRSRSSSLSRKPFRDTTSVDAYIDDTRLAITCAFSLYLLAAFVVPLDVIPLRDEFQMFANADFALPVSFVERQRLMFKLSEPQHSIAITDRFDNWTAVRLFERVTELVSLRLAFREISQATKTASMLIKTAEGKTPNFAEQLASQLEMSPKQSEKEQALTNITANLTIAWCRNLLARNWDGKAVVNRASPVGGCLQLMAAMFRRRFDLSLFPETFFMNMFAEKLSVMDMPAEWLAYKPNNKELHLLSFSFLFKPGTLVEYFRSINFSMMSKANLNAQVATRDVNNFQASPIHTMGTHIMQHIMTPYMARYLVLTVRRDSLVTDAINQIWRRQRVELMRPLKVLLGQDEGEQGIDHGGVQQEFFRVLFAQALDPDYGMFTIDERTRMTWFRPGSVEPLYKFEALGVLMSIAVFNAITLPVTFPLAFYRKLLGLKVKKLSHIQDGWPELARGLLQMLDWTDGDVGDVFMRTYEFTFETFGKMVSVDMDMYGVDEPWPPAERKRGKEKEKTASFELPPSLDNTPPRRRSTSPFAGPSTRRAISTGSGNAPPPTTSPPPADTHEAPLVTNANRQQFVSDYILWLTTKSIEAQFTSFKHGFYTCLDRTALSIFTPEALKQVVEGQPDDNPIDVTTLELVTQYEDGFYRDHPTIKDFWEIVRSWEPARVRALLEFVTASDRVPVQGMASVTFVVQRNGVVGDEGEYDSEAGSVVEMLEEELTAAQQVGTVIEDGDGEEDRESQDTAPEQVSPAEPLVDNTVTGGAGIVDLEEPLDSTGPPAETAASSTSRSLDLSMAERLGLPVLASWASIRPSELLSHPESLRTPTIEQHSPEAQIFAVGPYLGSGAFLFPPFSTDASIPVTNSSARAPQPDANSSPSDPASLARDTDAPTPYPGRLPTSMTCFGRLLLPEYTGGKEVLRQKLEKAVENSTGFGVA